MRDEHFTRLLGSLSQLSEEQVDTLLSAAQAHRHRSAGTKVLDTLQAERGCAHCKSPKTVKNGHSRGLQRYRCQSCGKSFNAATNTPLSRLRNKERFLQVGECLAKGLTLKAMAKELGIAESTALRLRHRFLSSVVSHQPSELTGLVEADETYFRESQKGSKRLITRGAPELVREARDRGGKPRVSTKLGKPVSRKDLVPVLVGRLRGQPHVADKVLQAMNKTQAMDALRNWVGPDTLLCTDGSGTLRQAAAELGVASKHVAVAYSGRVKEQIYHVQSVNRYHEVLKTWINRELRGVSTKYLPNYLAWMRLQQWFKGDLKPEHFIISGIGKQLINT
jgi:transposase-like protein